MAHARTVSDLSKVHPMVLFWLGLLTGAILVGLLFFYKMLSPVDYQSAISKGSLKNLNKGMVIETQLKGGIDAVSGIAPHGSVAPNGTGAASGIAPHGSVGPNGTGAASGIAPHGMVK